MRTDIPSRILADLRACTSPCSSGRGIGNLSLFWFTEMLRHRENRELYALVDVNGKERIPLPGLQGNRRIPFPPPPVWSSDRDWRGGEADSLSNAAYSSFVAPYRADVIHVAHAFEDYAAEPGGLPYRAMHSPHQVIAATVYDFIPMVFPEYYFRNTDFKHFYLSRVQWLRQADLLLSISNATRNDAIDIAGIAPHKVVVVPPRVDFGRYRPWTFADEEKRGFLGRYGIHRPFILYVGGDEYRKNIDGAVRAFALLPSGLRMRHQLVIACKVEDERRKSLLRMASGLGVRPDEVVITGFVPDEDLPPLYALCKLFIFPSYYEGLGLPLLEAMACGAPVLAGDNSSQREIIGRSDALFDAQKDASIAAAMHNALTDDGFRVALSQYSIERIHDFCRNDPGKIILEAFDEALARKRKTTFQYIQSGGLPRKRLAVFTPLPSDRSGIADYAAFFLPYLAEFFDIDIYTTCKQLRCPQITSAFRVYAAKDFPDAAAAYDHILYEFGNSAFHAHMFELLERFPGVVTLHDAYLSGVLYWMGREGFVREALYSHGSLARRILLPSRQVDNADFEAITKLPCTRRVLEQAVGVISHSRWNLELANSCYPEGLPSPYRIIPQAAKIAKPKSADERASIKKRLGLPENSIIIASYGHISFTKMNDIALDAFLNSKRLMENQDVYFIFVGQAGTDNYSIDIENRITEGTSSRIKITGYINDKDYELYLSVTDVAIQLRKDFRGGTPKGAVDAMAHGISVITNRYSGDYADYPDDVVYMLSEVPDETEVRSAIETLVYSPELRTKLANKSRDYIHMNNNPQICASLYADAIKEFYDICSNTTKKREIDVYTKSISPAVCREDTLKFAGWISSRSFVPAKRRKLFIDVGYTAENNPHTGISRVVREIVKNLYRLDMSEFDYIAVELKDGHLVPAISWLNSLGAIFPEENIPVDSVDFSCGDILLMLDSSWSRYNEYLPLFERLKKVGGEVITTIYDILPVVFPENDMVQGSREWFTNWLDTAIKQSDRIVGISSVAIEELRAWIEKRGLLPPTLSWWHLGADLPASTKSPCLIQETTSPQKPFLLIIGTIAPHKNQALAVDAFATLWEQGCELSLCIAGNEGWMVESLMSRIRDLNTNESRFIFIENPTDTDLEQLYGNAAGLLFPSKGEGFGLPIIEAAHYGTPVLCSDIPVFHEIAGDHAFYLDISSSDALAAGIATWWKLAQDGRAPSSAGIPVMTWEESTRQLLSAIGLIEKTN